MVPAPDMENRDNRRRPIRSYVLRQGRLTAGQERAFENVWPRLGVEFHGILEVFKQGDWTEVMPAQ